MISQSFGFTAVNSKYHGFQQARPFLFKWGIQEQFYVMRFSYDQYLSTYDLPRFLKDLFSHPSIKVRQNESWSALGPVDAVAYTELSHTVTSLDFFDRLEHRQIVRQNLDIAKCLDEYHDGFLVADALRKCLLVQQDESFETFSAMDRNEFIFCLFKALCLGGSLCQYEDTVKPYLDTTRLLYKDLIAVSKDPETQRLKVASMVFQIQGVSEKRLFPIDHPQNFCFVSIDPLKRHVNVFYHASSYYY